MPSTHTHTHTASEHTHTSTESSLPLHPTRASGDFLGQNHPLTAKLCTSNHLLNPSYVLKLPLSGKKGDPYDSVGIATDLKAVRMEACVYDGADRWRHAC